jgi:hypothetical protein
MNELVLERPEEEFRLMLYELIEEFVKKPDAELRIEMRNGDTLFLYSKDKIEFDLKLSYVKIRLIVKRTHFKSPSELDFEYVHAENIQVIRLDDIVSVTLINELEELEDE